MMMTDIEINNLDLRYECCRMKSAGLENKLLSSIAANGIRDPLQGVDSENDCRILLDGFKRYRCAKKLNIGIIPYQSLGKDEAFGIIKLLRISNAKSLSILEQSRLIDELKNIHKISISEIARLLERSKGWVGMRSGLINSMSKRVVKEVFSGNFPAYSYMYTIRSFMRMNGIKKEEVDEFVSSVSGKNLSIRDIEILANGYFKGGENIRQQIKKGNISWSLSRLKETSIEAVDCLEIEKKMLKDLEITQKYIRRVISKNNYNNFKTASFYAQANLLTGGILRLVDDFTKIIGRLNDITR